MSRQDISTSVEIAGKEHKLKPVKILAVLGALMTLAFVVGVSSAMAEETALCNTDPGTGSPQACPSGHLVTHVHEASATKAKLLTTFLTIECDVLFLGDVLKDSITSEYLSNPLIIQGTLTYTNCGSCTLAEENGPGEIIVLKLGHETADVLRENLVHMVCGKSLDCSYNGIGLLGTAKGPLLAKKNAKEEVEHPNGEVVIEKQTTNKEAGGFLCPATSKLDLTTTALTATYITN